MSGATQLRGKNPFICALRAKGERRRLPRIATGKRRAVKGFHLTRIGNFFNPDFSTVEQAIAPLRA
jgi:hypothetical protein